MPCTSELLKVGIIKLYAGFLSEFEIYWFSVRSLKSTVSFKISWFCIKSSLQGAKIYWFYVRCLSWFSVRSLKSAGSVSPSESISTLYESLANAQKRSNRPFQTHVIWCRLGKFLVTHSPFASTLLPINISRLVLYCRLRLTRFLSGTWFTSYCECATLGWGGEGLGCTVPYSLTCYRPTSSSGCRDVSGIQTSNYLFFVYRILGNVRTSSSPWNTGKLFATGIYDTICRSFLGHNFAVSGSGTIIKQGPNNMYVYESIIEFNFSSFLVLHRKAVCGSLDSIKAIRNSEFISWQPNDELHWFPGR